MAWGVGFVEGRLRAELAIFGASTGFGVDNRAEVYAVAAVVLADAVCHCDQVEDIRLVFEIEQLECFLSGDLDAFENALANGHDAVALVGRRRCHGLSVDLVVLCGIVHWLSLKRSERTDWLSGPNSPVMVTRPNCGSMVLGGVSSSWRLMSELGGSWSSGWTLACQFWGASTCSFPLTGLSLKL